MRPVTPIFCNWRATTPSRRPSERLRLAEQEKHTAIELAEARLSIKLEKEATKKEAEIAQMKAEMRRGWTPST